MRMYDKNGIPHKVMDVQVKDLESLAGWTKTRQEPKPEPEPKPESKPKPVPNPVKTQPVVDPKPKVESNMKTGIKK